MDYWKNRLIVQREKLLDKTIEECLREYRKIYKQTSKRLIHQIEKLYVELNSEPDVLISHRYSYNRKYDLLKQIQEELSKLGKKEVKLLDSSLTKLYKENSKIIGTSYNFQPRIDNDTVKMAINQLWVTDGLSFSDRIWKNKSLLMRLLETYLSDIVTTGKSHSELTKELMKVFGTSYNSSERLVRTELARIQIKSACDKYKESGLTHVRILEAIDNRTCEECLALNNQIVTIEEALKMLPRHPQCRATVLGVV